MGKITKATIAHCAYNILTKGDGEVLMDYLKSVTIHRVLEPPLEASEVIYNEGRRSVYADLVSLIETAEMLRANNGEDNGRSVTSLWDRANSRLDRTDGSA